MTRTASGREAHVCNWAQPVSDSAKRYGGSWVLN
jgi:hypothetical protein